MVQPDSLLEIEVDGTGAAAVHRTGQFRISRRCGALHGLPLYLITEVGPGLFPGERHEIRIRVRESARVAIAGQSALKIHAGEAALPAVLRVQIEVERGATLLFMPEPVVGYSGSRLDSATDIDADAGAIAAVGEIIAHPASTPHFGAPLLLSTTATIRLGGDLAMADRFSSFGDPVFTPAEAWLRATGGGCVGSLYLLGMEPPASKACAAGPAETLLATPVEKVSVLRVRAPEADRIQAVFREYAASLFEVGQSAVNAGAMAP